MEKIMQGKVVALTIYPDGRMSRDEFKTAPDYKYLRDKIEGPLETVPYFDVFVHDHQRVPAVAFCNEEHKLYEFHYNMAATTFWKIILNEHGIELDDALGGNVVIIYGDKNILDEL
jgi:hypothetical protein